MQRQLEQGRQAAITGLSKADVARREAQKRLEPQLEERRQAAIGAALTGLAMAQVTGREALQRWEPQLEEGRRAIVSFYAQLRENLPPR